MVSVVSGASLGLFHTSASILGDGGILGSGRLGQADGRGWVNAATGNLILQFQDGLSLSGRGLDLRHLRTYNSLGQDVGGWRSDERTVRFDAVANRLTWIGTDGHTTHYD